MWEFDHKEGWAPKNWCFQTVVIEKTLESPLDWKNIKPVNPKGDQSWISIGRTDAEAEDPKLLLPDVNSRLIRKDPDAGRDWRQEKKIEGSGWDSWKASPTLWAWIWAASGRWWRTGRPTVPGVTKSWTWLRDWTTSGIHLCYQMLFTGILSLGFAQ